MDKALGTGRIGAIFGPILGSCLIGRGWSTLIMLEFAAVPTMFATVAQPGSRTESRSDRVNWAKNEIDATSVQSLPRWFALRFDAQS
jgi:hypothetical protein